MFDFQMNTEYEPEWADGCLLSLGYSMNCLCFHHIQMQCTFNLDGLGLFYFLLVEDFVMLYVLHCCIQNRPKFATIVVLLMIISSGSTYGYCKWCHRLVICGSHIRFDIFRLVCGMKRTKSAGDWNSWILEIWLWMENGKLSVVQPERKKSFLRFFLTIQPFTACRRIDQENANLFKTWESIK